MTSGGSFDVTSIFMLYPILSYYGYYSNLSRGKRKKQEQDEETQHHAVKLPLTHKENFPYTPPEITL
jgi:hypothetical protein